MTDQNATIHPSEQVDVEHLQRVADFYCAKKKLRRLSVYGFFWGLLNGAIAYGFMEDSHFSLAGMLLGSFIGVVACCQIISGFWLLFSPSMIGVMFGNVGLLLVGILNILLGLSVLFIKQGNLGDVQWGASCLVTGAIQIWNGIYLLRQDRRYREIFAVQPDLDCLQFVKSLIEKTRKRKYPKEEDTVQFKTNTRFGTHRWNGWLMDEHGVLVDLLGHYLENARSPEVFIATREDVEIVRKRKYFLQKKYRVDINIRGHVLQGSMHLKSLERYEQWKQESPSAAINEAQSEV